MGFTKRVLFIGVSRVCMTDFDTIVLGIGCAGAAVCSELAQRGQDVLGIEQFDIVNEFGSSHGDIRLFRFAYHEGEAYVPLLYESADRWAELSSERSILESIGSATIGRSDSEKFQNAKQTCETHNISYEILTGDEFSERFGMWSVPSEFRIVYQKDGGVLHSRRGIKSLVAEAKDGGASVWTNTEVTAWNDDSNGVSVELASGETVQAESLVITSGPWASTIDEVADGLTVERHLVSFLDYDSVEFESPNAPIWVFDGGEGNRFYGSPSVFGEVKLGNLDGDVETTISDLSREWELYDLLPEVSFSRSYFSMQPSSIRGEVCPLTHTPDGDFIIDSSTEFENVYYGVGLSGHGLKLAPAIGRLVAECVLDGETKDMFSLSRF